MAIVVILVITFWWSPLPGPASAKLPSVKGTSTGQTAQVSTRTLANPPVLRGKSQLEADAMPQFFTANSQDAVEEPSGSSQVVGPAESERPLLLESLQSLMEMPTATDQAPMSATPITADHMDVAANSVILDIAVESGVDSGREPNETVQANVEAEEPAQEDVSDQFSANIHSVQSLMDQGRALEARQLLSRLLDRDGHRLSMVESRLVRHVLNEVNDTLLLSRAMTFGDPLVVEYTVERGDMLLQIGPRYKVPYQLIMRINGISKPERLRADSRIKVIRGPFHAILTKDAYRMDVYAVGPEGRRIFVYSFAVGLGVGDSTPEGQWIVRRGKKEDPDWRNPQTNQYFAAADLANPIGEYWIPIKGIDEITRPLHGYGIHGTIDPESIGKQASMGCVRMLPDEVKLLFEMLTEDESRITIRP